MVSTRKSPAVRRSDSRHAASRSRPFQLGMTIEMSGACSTSSRPSLDDPTPRSKGRLARRHIRRHRNRKRTSQSRCHARRAASLPNAASDRGSISNAETLQSVERMNCLRETRQAPWPAPCFLASAGATLERQRQRRGYCRVELANPHRYAWASIDAPYDQPPPSRAPTSGRAKMPTCSRARLAARQSRRRAVRRMGTATGASPGTVSAARRAPALEALAWVNTRYLDDHLARLTERRPRRFGRPRILRTPSPPAALAAQLAPRAAPHVAAALHVAGDLCLALRRTGAASVRR